MNTQLELANAIGVSEAAISFWEAGKRTPKENSILKICARYKIDKKTLCFANLSRIQVLPIKDKIDTIKTTKITDLIPMVCSPKAMTNLNFKKAYAIQTELFAMIEDRGLSASLLGMENWELCRGLYENSYEESKNVESIANQLCWLILTIFYVSCLHPKAWEVSNIFRKSVDFEKELFEALSIVDEEDEKYYANDFVELESTRLQILETYEDKILSHIHVLNCSSSYADLGNYYLAFMYSCGMRNSFLPRGECQKVGAELMITFAKMGNLYAKNYVSKFLRNLL